MPGTSFHAKDPDTSNFIALNDENGLPVLMHGTTVPVSGAFAKGCLFIKTDAATGVKGLYENQGTTTTPSFNIVGDVSAAEIALADADILVGNASGVGAAVTPSGDVSMTNAGAYTLTKPNSLIVVQAHKSAVGNSESDTEIYEYLTTQALTLESAQVYCTATTATASVEIKEAGTTVLSSAITPSANSNVAGTISDSAIASGALLTVHVTTDGTGDITDLMVTLTLKTIHLA